MPNKQCDRIYRTEKTKKISYCNHTTQNFQSDEIALRDEILELKKQVIILKKTNEKNFIKFRKYEDEVKRKDREIEQLMDPRKNAEIAKVLSTKGAAILMNLKDQNNSLIQMVLNKDLQIKRLSAEIKMSKLYTTTKKNGSQAQPALRLKNLLRQVQESLKENASANSQRQESSSGAFDFSSSSEQSSPRELNDLMLTLQSLETYIKYSNDLLAKKNQEISLLTEEIKALRKTLKYKEYKYRGQNNFFQLEEHDYFSKKLFTNDENCFGLNKHRQLQNKSLSDKNLFSSQNPDKEEKLPHSAPNTSSSQFSQFKINGDTRLDGNLPVEDNDFEEEKEFQTPNKFSSFSSTPIKTPLKNKFSTPIKSRQEKRSKVKEKWKKAWMMHKMLKKQNEGKQNQKDFGKSSSRETKVKKNEQECLNTKKVIISQVNNFEEEEANEQYENPNSIEHLNEYKADETEGFEVLENECDGKEEVNSLKSEESTLSVAHADGKLLDSTDCEENEFAIKSENLVGESVNENETSNAIESLVSKSSEADTLVSKSIEKVFQQNLDSSFESDNTPVKPVQVEVQINAVYFQTQEDNSSEEKSLDVWTNDGDSGSDYDDDDDVVVK